jgi:hypothetical protein
MRADAEACVVKFEVIHRQPALKVLPLGSARRWYSSGSVGWGELQHADAGVVLEPFRFVHVGLENIQRLMTRRRSGHDTIKEISV